jgi:hydrogenase/urease accessory protein HupE
VEGNSVKGRGKKIGLFGSIAILMLNPLPVQAHLNTTGLGPVYDGLLHFVLSPEDFVPVLAIALYGGLRGAPHGRRALFTLPAAWLAAGFVGMTLSTSVGGSLTACSFLLLGGLVAADVKLSLHATTALATVLGFLHGYLNGAAMDQPGAGALALVGLVFGVFVLVALSAAFVTRLHLPWTRIAVRVLGSWIAASGLLMLGWTMRS